MNFPWIHPEDVERMTESERLYRLKKLRKEMRAAAVRHREILTARADRERAEAAGEAARFLATRRTFAFTEAERDEGERVLMEHRLLVQQGLRKGDGSLNDDLRAASNAVRRGSRNPYLLALERERTRLVKARSRHNSRKVQARQRIREGAAA